MCTSIFAFLTQKPANQPRRKEILRRFGPLRLVFLRKNEYNGEKLAYERGGWMPSKDNSVASCAQQILKQVKTVVVGKDPVLLWVLAAILARGHILLEDIPGVGKTTMALAFSRVLSLSCSRVQFTPDVLPSDVTGYSVPDSAGGMRYQPGAVLCNLFLADELNRGTSRTQSALLEAMEEGQVTVDGVSHPLP